MINDYCINCYNPVSKSAKYCSNCGAPQSSFRITHHEWLASTLPGSFRETVKSLITMYNEVRVSNFVLITNNYSCLDRLVIKRQENTTKLGLAGQLERLKSYDVTSACSTDLQVLLFCICYVEYEDLRRYEDAHGGIEDALLVVRQLMDKNVKIIPFVDSLGPVWNKTASFRFGIGCDANKPEVQAVEKFIKWFRTKQEDSL